MPRYEIRPKQPILVAGQQVTQEDTIAVVACDLPVRDVLSLVQFGNATVTEIGVVDSDEESGDEDAGDFAQYSAKVQAALADAGIVTLAQAALYVRDHGSLEPLDGIGRTTSKLIVKQIEAAGLPI